MVSPVVLNGLKGRRMFWNIDANVGPGCPNRPDDVQLVQMGFVSISKNPRVLGLLTPVERAALAKVKIGALYHGAPDDPLSLAIRAYQAHFGGTQDGHVSTIANNSLSYDGKNAFIMVALNISLRDMTAKYFPRLDSHPECPTALRISVMMGLLGGVG